jgi:uncharacterized RDD family membrane protein YckC
VLEKPTEAGQRRGDGAREAGQNPSGGGTSPPRLKSPGAGSGWAIPGPLIQCYADATGRLIAYMIDAVIVSVIVLAGATVLSVLLGPAVSFSGATITVDRELAVLNATMATAINLLYFVMLWTRLSATLAQRLLKLQVVSTSGEGLALGQAVIRWILLSAPAVAAGVAAALGQVVSWIDILALAWYTALLITTALSPTKRGLHDRVAGTIVTRSVCIVRFDESGGVETPVVR